MALIVLHRKDMELMGKELSANTVASFLVTQGVVSVADLEVGRVMNGSALNFLNRDRALQYWQGEGWLVSAQGGYALTPDGLDEVCAREAGVAVNESGRKKPGNIDPERVRVARLFILRGEADNHGVLRREFAVPTQSA